MFIYIITLTITNGDRVVSVLSLEETFFHIQDSGQLLSKNVLFSSVLAHICVTLNFFWRGPSAERPFSFELKAEMRGKR